MSDPTQSSLHGVRVLDFTQFLSGPYCTQILADLGAEVTKIESPEGDLARHIPPHFVGNDSVYFLSVNRGKKSLAVDLKSADGQGLLRKLILESDVVVENFRPGILAKLGVSATGLRELKPSLVWCSISGFGQDGPYRNKPAYDMIVQAMSGGMSLTGEPGRAAVRAGIPIGDISAGMYGAIGILAALFSRGVTGRGDYIDISMLDCQAAMLSYQAAYHLHSGEIPQRQGRGHDSIPTYRAFEASDCHDVVVTANTERMWQGLCSALGVPLLVDDPDFANNKRRFENRFRLWPLLEEAFCRKTAAEWIPLLEKESVPAALLNDIGQLVEDPQIKHRDMVMTFRKGRQSLRVMGNPIHSLTTRPSTMRFPPELGENTVEVLKNVLGLDEDTISDLTDRGVILTPCKQVQ